MIAESLENEDLIRELRERGFASHERGELDDAERAYREVLTRAPQDWEVAHALGVLALQTGRFSDASALLTQVIRHRDSAVSQGDLGNAFLGLSRLDEAIRCYDRAILLQEDYAPAHLNRGHALLALNRQREALASYDRATHARPEFFEAHFARAELLLSLNRPAEALAGCDRALALRPDCADAFVIRARALASLQHMGQALASLDEAIALDGACCAAYFERGNLFKELKQWDAALTSFDQAIAIKPDFVAAHSNRGLVLMQLQRREAARASFDRALAIRDFAAGHLNRGLVLRELEEWDAALSSFDKATALEPDDAKGHYGRAMVLGRLGRFDEALASADRALALNHDLEYLPGVRLRLKSEICDWDGFEPLAADLTARIERGEPAALPFAVLTFSNSGALQREAAEIWVRAQGAVNPPLPEIPRRQHGKIRIGYFSADFRNHPVSILIARMIELHDRSRFDVIAFSFGPDTQDELRKRMEAAFDSFHDVRNQSDHDIALLARSMEIDIAVDLTGFTDGARPGIFARRAAPLQVGYLGYLGTLGAPYMDYLVADTTIVPAAHQGHYAEKMLYVPSYQVNEPLRSAADRPSTRAELGLPSAGFVFCCFNAHYKITPATFDCWMRILNRVEGSVLFLYAGNRQAEQNLLKEAHRRGVGPERLIFGGHLPVPAYLARYRAADLFLDTLPYNAGTTASDALWMGVPVLTRLGETFAGRVAASLLGALGLAELATATVSDYENLAVELATSPERLAAIRRRLADNRVKSRLYDPERFTHCLEAAYLGIHERHHAGLAPDHFHAIER